MITQTSAVNTNLHQACSLKLCCLMERQNSHPVIHLFKQESNQTIRLIFPCIISYNQMLLCDLSSDAPDIAHYFVVCNTKVVTKYEGVSKMSEKSMSEAVKNCVMRRPKVWMTFDLASNNFIYLLSNTASWLGCLGSELILEA